MSHKQTFTVFGKEFAVVVKQNGDYREKHEHRLVEVHDEEKRKANAHGYVLVTDKSRNASKIFGEDEEMIPLGEQVGRAVNKAIQKYVNNESEQRTKEQEIQNAIDSVTQLWKEQLEQVEEWDTDG